MVSIIQESIRVAGSLSGLLGCDWLDLHLRYKVMTFGLIAAELIKRVASKPIEIALRGMVASDNGCQYRSFASLPWLAC